MQVQLLLGVPLKPRCSKEIAGFLKIINKVLYKIHHRDLSDNGI